MLPLALKNIFSAYPDDHYSMPIVSVKLEKNDLLIDFDVITQAFNKEDAITQKWTISAKEVLYNKVSIGRNDYLKLTDTHPLLWAFTDIKSELYFSGECRNFHKIFYDLYSTHHQMFSGYAAFDLSLISRTGHNIFQYTNGLLATGSKKILEVYSECLKQNGLEYTLIEEWPAAYSEATVLLFSNMSYVIAKEFVFTLNEEVRNRL